MRTNDFAPLCRSTIGFDCIFGRLDGAQEIPEAMTPRRIPIGIARSSTEIEARQAA